MSREWPNTDLFYQWLQSKKRAKESLIDCAERLLTTIAYTETILKDQDLKSMADWLDLASDTTDEVRQIRARDLAKKYNLGIDLGRQNTSVETEGGFKFPVGTSMEEVEFELIRSTLTQTEGHQNKAAKILGISPKTIYTKIKKYGL